MSARPAPTPSPSPQGRGESWGSPVPQPDLPPLEGEGLRVGWSGGLGSGEIRT
jgi:hypothetical protein